MRITVDGKDYHVDYQYNGRFTYCHIDDLQGNLVSGWTKRSLKDKPEKEKARKMSLQRALELMGIDRNTRGKFWKAIHEFRGKTEYLKHAGVN